MCGQIRVMHCALLFKNLGRYAKTIVDSEKADG